ncbi:MAG: hypothetical protein KDD44_07810, partial [Bdellovibrionales bacterium]|nr:hypothetical protein [Bdellovibrionales bacterium]
MPRKKAEQPPSERPISIVHSPTLSRFEKGAIVLAVVLFGSVLGAWIDYNNQRVEAEVIRAELDVVNQRLQPENFDPEAREDLQNVLTEARAKTTAL